MNRTVVALTASTLLLGGIAFAAPGDILFGSEFNTDGDFEGWIDNGDKLKEFGWNGTTVIGEEMVTGGVFSAKLTQGTNNDAQMLNNPMDPSVNADLAGSLEIRIRQTADDGTTWKAPGNLNGFLVRFGGANPGTPTQTSDEDVPGDGWTIVTYNLNGLVSQTWTSFRFDPATTLDDSFEVDYIRILETDIPRPTLEIDPVDPIPDGFNLTNEWDTAAQLGDLGLSQFTNVVIGPCSTGTGDCLTATSDGGDPKVETPEFLSSVAADGTAIVEIGVIPSTTTGVGTADGDIFWTDNDGGSGGTRRIKVPLFTEEQIDGSLIVIRVTMDSYVSGALKGVRYDPFSGSALDVEVDYIRIYTDTPLPTSLSWDPDNGTSGVQGGPGNWNTTDTFWNDGTATNIAWPATPSGDDNALFGATAGIVTIDPAGITATSLILETDGYTITGGDLTMDGSARAPAIVVEGASTSAVISSVIDGNDDNVRKNGDGALTLDADSTFNSFTAAGGTVTVPSGRTIETLGSNPDENNYGFKLLSDSTLNIDGTITLGEGSFGGFSTNKDFVVNLNTNGALTVPGDAPAGWNANGTYNFNGGTSNISGSILHRDGGNGIVNYFDGDHSIGGRLGALTNGGGSNSVFTISGGSVITGTVGYQAGTGTGAPLGTNSLTVNLNGGTLETNRIFLDRGPATSPGDVTFNLNLDGGTIRATSGGGSSTMIDGNIGQEFLGPVAFNVSLGANGVTFDTNGESKSIDQAIIESSPGGTVTKTGLGNLYFNEQNDYDGDTNITAGNVGGSGNIPGDVNIDAGAGLAYFITDPLSPPSELFIDGTLSVPDPLVISIDSGGVVFPEESASDLLVVDAILSGFNLETVVLDTSRFTGFGTWTVSESDGQIALSYTAGSDPFANYMSGFFPGEVDPLIVGPGADPDNDGTSNVEEFAYGGNPDDGSDNGPRTSAINDVGGSDFLTLTVAVRTGAVFTGATSQTASIDGVVYTIGGSMDLTSFDESVSELGTAITTGLPETPPSGYEYRTFQLNPDTSAGIGFLRSLAVGE